MKSPLPLDELRQVAWIGDDAVSGPIRGVVLNFHGLGAPALKTEADEEERHYGRLGLLTVLPYSGPWSWMNRATRAFTDQLVDGLYRHYRLGDTVPLLSTGGSMGGHSALLYTRYAAARPVTACVAVFPVTDLKAHFGERPDLPRTIRYAFREMSEPLEELFAEHSPQEQVSRMPDIPYLLIHGERDQAVNKQIHSDRLAAAMRERGLNLTYLESEDLDHGPLPPALAEKKRAFVASFAR